MSYRINRYSIRKIDKTNRTISFDPSKCGKITGSRFQAVLGRDSYHTEFYAACLISRIYSEYEPTKYTEAGEKIEPVIRAHVRKCSEDLLRKKMGLSEGEKITVEDPVSKNDCGYDHFKFNPVFGGMVDGYIRVNGVRRAILEIKTSNDRTKWEGPNGDISAVPENYMLQASLYAELANLDEIVFAVGFLNEGDYDEPEKWTPDNDNFAVIRVVKKDISEEIEAGKAWFNKYIKHGVTPEWTDDDAELVDRFLVRDIDFVSADFSEKINRYLETKDSVLESLIKEKFIKMLGDSKATVYSQNGYTFRLSRDENNEFILIVEKAK